MTAGADWLRSKAAVVLLAATFALTIVLGAGFIALHRVRDLQGAAVELPGSPLSDEQSKLQVLAAARQFVGVGRLRNPTASYLLMSCKNNDDPPYQGAIRLNFDIPELKDIPKYFNDFATSMTARGWVVPKTTDGGRGRPILTKDGITAIYNLNPDAPGRATMQIYGECRNITDHRRDTTGWVEITGQLR